MKKDVIENLTKEIYNTGMTKKERQMEIIYQLT
jgi:hypothetical protein